MTRTSLAWALAILAAVPVAAEAAATPLHIKWDGLDVAVGKTVSIAMPNGASIQGKAVGVEADALVVDVKKSSDRAAYPRGIVRVPRTSLHWFQMQKKGHAYRIVLTPLGFLLGLTFGAGAAWDIGGGRAGVTKQLTAFFGIWTAGTVGGYFLGNAADKKWVPVEILPD